jgi:hypothetical protein
MLPRDLPYELRYYPALTIDQVYTPLLSRWKGVGFPQHNRQMVDWLKMSIDKEGLKNPLTVEWFDPWNDTERADEKDKRWSVRIGSNRLIALLELDFKEAPALVIRPHGIAGPEGSYKPLNFQSALALFTADHPWWHSYILRDFCPKMVPKGA